MPGIEYFAARSDAEAVAFTEGSATREIPILRADGLFPGDVLAALGALLTGRSIDELSAEESLRILSTDEREEFSVLLVALPDEFSAALRTADDATLLDVGRRASVYAEFAAVPPEVVAAILAELAHLLDDGGTALYARLLVPRDAAIVRPSWTQWVVRIAPWAGLAVATILVVAVIVLTTSRLSPVLYPAAGALAAVSLGVLFRRRHVERATRTTAARGALVLTWVADRAARSRLREVVRDVLPDEEPPSTGRVRGRWGYLAVDPSGLVVHAGDEAPVRFPRHLIVDIAPSSTIARSGGFGLRAPTPGVAVALRTRDGGTTTWIAPLVTTAGTAIARTDAAALSADINALLGPRSSSARD